MPHWFTHIFYTLTLASFVMATALTVSSPTRADEKNAENSNDWKGLQVMGWVESVVIMPGKIKMKAKLDSGATTSSIDANIIEIYKKDRKNFVKFTLRDIRGKEYEMNERIRRWVRIKKKASSSRLADLCEASSEKEKKSQKFVESCFIRRPVVRLVFCIGNQYIEQEVNLAKREHFLYPVLVGRNMLGGNILVDSSATYTTKPKCSGKK